MPPKVLVVDDAEHIHSQVRLHFAEEKVELHSAYYGEFALELAEELLPDLILLDVNLPDMDGFEMCRRLRENPSTLKTLVIFLTAMAETRKIVRGLELGAMDYIIKPFDGAVLVARVRASLRVKSRLDFLSERRVSQLTSDGSMGTTSTQNDS